MRRTPQNRLQTCLQGELIKKEKRNIFLFRFQQKTDVGQHPLHHPNI